MKKFLEKSIKSLTSVTDKATEELNSRFELVKEMINELPIFISSEKTSTYGNIKYDEKHYFVIPFMLSDSKIILHTMRCLPEGVPEVNDLPKRRVFHFPNQDSEAVVRKVLSENAKDIVEQQHANSSNTLINLANDIDSLDKKLTYGMLTVGGIAALVNPLLGASIAAKALLPGVAGLLSKYGLRPAGEKLNESQIRKKIKEAEENVQNEFKSASTIQVVNPILQELELALRTSESEHDPLIDFDLSMGNIEELDSNRWRELTLTAFRHTYSDLINNPEKHSEACLGPEDIRWFKVILNL